jgi:hypothetical protein
MIRLGPVLLLLACAAHPGETCTPQHQGGLFCVPDSGRAANIDVKLELKDECTSACDHGTLSCEVTFDGGAIALALVGELCSDPTMACPAVCGMKTFACALPALPDGTYPVTSMGYPTQMLTVGPGGSPSCTVP